MSDLVANTLIHWAIPLAHTICQRAICPPSPLIRSVLPSLASYSIVRLVYPIINTGRNIRRQKEEESGVQHLTSHGCPIGDVYLPSLLHIKYIEVFSFQYKLDTTWNHLRTESQWRITLIRLTCWVCLWRTVLIRLTDMERTIPLWVAPFPTHGFLICMRVGKVGWIQISKRTCLPMDVL